MNTAKFLPYTGAVILFVIASLLYFNPVLSGKQIKQSDITQYIGMAKEMNDFRDDKKEEPYWIGNAFSGMPAYQAGARFPNDFIKQFDYLLRFLPRPADYLFLYFIGFFFLLNALKVDWKLAIPGSLFFGFSTYLIIILGAGHNAKAHAIAYMPIVITGVLYVFQKRYLSGFIITSLGMALEIMTNHIQITYYLGFCLLILGISEAMEAIKNKKFLTFTKQTGVLLVAFLLGTGINATRLLATKEYVKYSTRGISELTTTPDGASKNRSKGLDKEYITEYSYGILETFNLIVPRFMGGGTVEKLNESSDFYQILEQNAGSRVAGDYSSQVFTYWGKQPIVEAPAYIGAVLFFLFFIGIFLVEGKIKYWLVATTVFSILLSWGKNLPLISNFFIDYVPLYNKFRAVSSIQVITELCVPLLGILGLKEFLFSKQALEKKQKVLNKATIFSGGIILSGLLLAYMSSTFEGMRDNQYQQLQLPGLIEALISDRKAMLLSDSFRSIILIGLSAGVLWLFLKNKVKLIPVILITGFLTLFDLLSVDLNYVNKDDFTDAENVQNPFTANKANQEILQDKTHYRVANFTVNLMNEAETSYFHKSVGGYHAAKMMRYQELFEYQMTKNSFEILNMLNTKYFIVGEEHIETNDKANGNAWFVNKLKLADTADEEISALDNLNTKKKAVIRRDKYKGNTAFTVDSSATINLKKYDTNYLAYTSNSSKEQFAVFSEIYYKDGWNAYIDEKLTPHYQVDYVLRGMNIPAGKHTIEFKFEPIIINQGKMISMLFYFLIILIPLIWFFLQKNLTILQLY